MSYARAPSPSPSQESSDLDLDLEELAPSLTYTPARRSFLGGNHTRPFTSSPSHKSPRRSEEQAAPGRVGGFSSPRIALKTFAMGLGGRRRGGAGDDDEEALLGGDEGGRGTSNDNNDMPLLRRWSSRLSLRDPDGGSPSGTVSPRFQPSTETRLVYLDGTTGPGKAVRYPPNLISNHRFTAFTFLPLTLYHEFSFFFNMYFLLVALSQIVPALRIGYLSTYIVPLVFVLSITLGKEAHDDIARRRRDKEANSEPYDVMATPGVDRPQRRGHLGKLGNSPPVLEGVGLKEAEGEMVRTIIKKSKDLKVGDILVLKKDQRVPADVVILKAISNEASAEAKEEEEEATDQTSGETFIRTDQLDGETDWKLRLALPLTQELPIRELAQVVITASAPSKAVNEFLGTLEYKGTHMSAAGPASGSGPKGSMSIALSIDNTAWANTVVASNSTTLAAVAYTGPETRAALSTSQSRSKTGLLENEINNLTKILCFLTFTLSFVLVAINGFGSEPNKPGVTDPENPEQVVSGAWYVKVLRFLILFSTIVPISLRVNLDMGKSAYAWFIEKDKDIPGTVVRTSTIPEELGRVEYLLSDKTGTLTQNDMELKKVHVGTVSYAGEAMDEVAQYIRRAFSGSADATLTASTTAGSTVASTTRTRREIGSRVKDVVLALALCHNVTPTTTTNEAGAEETAYQASSPDEIAIVRWAESVGLRLAHRDRTTMKLQSVETGEIVIRVRILEVFPFTSESKRMGTVVQFLDGDKSNTERDLLNHGDGDGEGSADEKTGEIWFFQKGADTIMSAIVASNDWLDEECGNMAREGLRTLVVGRKKLSRQRYQEFSEKHKAASLLFQGRDKEMGRIVEEYLEKDLELLGITGVEDKLQKDVKSSLELLRNAGIKIWMLTGDKVETARCVAVSAKLVARGQYIHTIAKCRSLHNRISRRIADLFRSKAKRGCVRAAGIHQQQDRLLPPNRRRVVGSLFGQLSGCFHIHSSTTSCRCRLPLYPNAKGRCCTINSRFYTKAHMLYWGWRQRRVDDTGRRRWCWYCGQRGSTSLFSRRLFDRAVLLPYKAAGMARTKQLQAQCQAGTVCHA